MVKLTTLVEQLMKRAIDIPLGDVKEPDHWQELAEGEEVIAVIDDDLKRLCVVSCMAADAADKFAHEIVGKAQSMLERSFSADEKLLDEIESLRLKTELLSLESELACSMFACSLRSRYLSKIGDSQIKMCKGWKIVKVVETTLPLFAIPIPPGLGKAIAQMLASRRR